MSVPDPFLRHKVWRGLNTDEVAEGNVSAVDAAVAAFTEGGQYGKTGERFLRMNIACPRSRLLDGLERLKTGTLAYGQKM